MRVEIIVLAAIVGFCNWAFRFFPTRADLSGLPDKSPLARFLSATGPAAIATLFVASILPRLSPAAGLPTPLLAGSAAVVAVFAGSRSVVVATMSGSAIYALVHWWLA